MKVCLPVQDSKGFYSLICPHFGSAPWYLIHDTDTQSEKYLRTKTEGHLRGNCLPLELLGSDRAVAVIVRRIGQKALSRLKESEVAVLRSDSKTVAGALIELNDGTLKDFEGFSGKRDLRQEFTANYTYLQALIPQEAATITLGQIPAIPYGPQW